MTGNWLALLVQSGAEQRCRSWLERRQLKPYWPHYPVLVKLARHKRSPKVLRWRAVIPGYLFLPALGGLNLRLIRRYSPYIRGVLTDADGNWINIPANGRNGIEQIRAIEEALNASPIAAAQGIPFKTKQRVRIERFDTEGTIQRIDGARRIDVEIMMFGRMSRVTLPVAEIEAV